MFELPDRRAFLILAIAIGACIPGFAVAPTNAYAPMLERLQYVAMIGAGFAFTWLDLRDGYCLNRPSVTREESPILFWIEVLVSCSLVVIGGYRLWQLL